MVSHHPPLDLTNRSLATKTTLATLFSQTIVDVDIGALPLSGGNALTYNVPQSRDTLRKITSPRVNISNTTGSDSSSLAAVESNSSQAVNCREDESNIFQRRVLRLQFSVYPTGVLFQEAQDEDVSASKRLALDSWVVGVKVNDLESVTLNSSEAIVRLSFLTFTAVRGCWRLALVCF